MYEAYLLKRYGRKTAQSAYIVDIFHYQVSRKHPVPQPKKRYMYLWAKSHRSQNCWLFNGPPESISTYLRWEHFCEQVNLNLLGTSSLGPVPLSYFRSMQYTTWIRNRIHTFKYGPNSLSSSSAAQANEASYEDLPGLKAAVLWGQLWVQVSYEIL